LLIENSKFTATWHEEIASHLTDPAKSKQRSSWAISHLESLIHNTSKKALLREEYKDKYRDAVAATGSLYLYIMFNDNFKRLDDLNSSKQPPGVSTEVANSSFQGVCEIPLNQGNGTTQGRFYCEQDELF
jgi:hypothetical protein